MSDTKTPKDTDTLPEKKPFRFDSGPGFDQGHLPANGELPSEKK